MGVHCTYVCGVLHVCSAHRDQEKVLETLKLELWMVVGHHVGAGF